MQWKTINGWEMCGGVIARVALRTLVGYPMCRNQTLLNQTRKFADALFGDAAVINCTPPFMRPVMAPLLALPAKMYGARYRKILEPLVMERIQLVDEYNKSGEGELPHMDPTKISMRILALNTMFIFAMSYVFGHTVIDLCVSPDKEEFFCGIDQECRRVMREYHDAHPEGGLASKQAIDQLYRNDSAIRESMRLSDVGIVTLPRDVVGNKPLDLGNGIIAPPGTRMQQDDDEKEWELMVTLTPGVLAFGYGKRACPGRWFVVQILKQALGYLIMNYEIEFIGEAPKRKVLLNMMIPPTNAKLRIRRKFE
ncbi:cytochrome P450 [Podospora fimiseda]|uniref:Cytochrome P450 n=1 Tax=Podospora fimiseda TaxID=252190 RepID=A0AAN6YL39_9PEZI|nr:cytochrome P450 [Podospora fimiseda]